MTPEERITRRLEAERRAVLAVIGTGDELSRLSQDAQSMFGATIAYLRTGRTVLVKPPDYLKLPKLNAQDMPLTAPPWPRK